MRIGQLGAATDTKVETIRYYEQIGVLSPPARSPSSYRSYGMEHLQRLAFIRRARDLGFPLDQVRELLSFADYKEQSCEVVDDIARMHRATVARKMSELRALGDELDRLLGQCGHGAIRSEEHTSELQPLMRISH